MAIHGIIDGSGSRNMFTANDLQVDLHSNGVQLRRKTTGEEHFIKTAGRPHPGGKIFAADSLSGVVESRLISKVDSGGGLIGVGIPLAQRFRGGNGQSLLLSSSGESTPELDELGVQSLGRHNTPTNLIIQLKSDRLIIKEPIQSPPVALEGKQLASIITAAANVAFTVSASSKDAALALAVLAAGNGAYRYAQLTGGLSPEMTLVMAKASHELAANLGEWSGVAQSAGYDVPHISEGDAVAPTAAAKILRLLGSNGWAGKAAAIVTLGRHGSVVADWAADQLFHIHIETACSVPTPAGTGDRWFAEYIYLRETWSKQGHLCTPVPSTALRATHIVARSLGLPSGGYDAYVTEL